MRPLSAFLVFFSAYRASYVSISEILNAKTASLQDERTRRWRDYKLQELYFVGVTAALIASLFGGAFSWYTAQDAPWTVQIIWYTGLVCTIAAISIATQQSVSLYRFSASEKGLVRIRGVLAGPHNSRGVCEPARFAVYVWQVPVMLLRFSIILFLLGLLVLLWTMASRTSGNLKVAIIFSVVLVAVLLNHWFCSICIYGLPFGAARSRETN